MKFRYLLILLFMACATPKPTTAPIAPAQAPAQWSWPTEVRVLVRQGRTLRDLGSPGPQQSISDILAQHGEASTVPCLLEIVRFPDDDAQHNALRTALAHNHVAALRLPRLAHGGTELAALDALSELRELDLRGSNLAAAALPPRLAAQLTTLRLAETNVSDAQLGAWLAAMPRLETLELRHTRITQAALAQLATPAALRAIDLAATPVTDELATLLPRWTGLTVIDLTDTHVSAAIVPALATLPVTELWLGGTRITSGLAALAPMAPRLTHLDLSQLPVRDPDVRWLAAATQLTTFLGNGTKLGDGTAKQLATLPALETLALNHTALTAKGVAPLARATRLEVIDVGNTPLTDAVVRPLLALPRLRALNLDNTKITDAALRAKPMPELRELYVANTRVSDGTLAPLLTSHPALRALGARGTGIGPQSLKALPHTLRILDLGHTAVDATSLAEVWRLTDLTELLLDGLPLTDADSAKLATLTNLTTLHLARTPIKDIRFLAQLPKLATLELTRTEVVDLEPITQHPNLRELALASSILDGQVLTELTWPTSLRTLWLADNAISLEQALVLIRTPNLRFIDLRTCPASKTPAARQRLQQAVPPGLVVQLE